MGFIVEKGVLVGHDGVSGDIILPRSVKSVGDWAFMDCLDITSIEFNGKITRIGEGAFAECINLQSVKLNGIDNIAIADSAFRGCKSLITVYNLDKVNKLGEFAFKDCTNLDSETELMVKNLIESRNYDGAFDYKNKK